MKQLAPGLKPEEVDEVIILNLVRFLKNLM